MTFNSRKRKRVISFVISIVFLLPIALLCIPPENFVSAEPGHDSDYGFVRYPWAWSTFRQVGSTSSGGNYAHGYDKITENYNPSHNNDNDFARYVSTGFVWDNYGGAVVWDVLNGSYFDEDYPDNEIPPETGQNNCTLVSADVKLWASYAFPEETANWDMNTGWFSIIWNYSDVEDNCPWWLNITQSTSYTTQSAFRTASNAWMTNSSIFNYSTGDWCFAQVPPIHPHYDHSWNITALVNLSQLKAPHFGVVWNTNKNITGHTVDYLGIEYVFKTWVGYEPPGDGEIPISPDFQSNFAALIWLMMFYIPTIAITQFVPKYGFILGMGVILIVFGSVQDGFLPVMIFGLTSLGILAYKGG